MTKEGKKLLPSGFYDRIGGEAIREEECNSALLGLLNKLGFVLMKPCFMEFEDGLDKDFTSGFFKVTDSVSNRMMVIRNDITPQIARIIEQDHKITQKNYPKRISYTGTIVKKIGQGKFLEREITQTGFEVIGGDHLKSDVEVILLADSLLNSQGLKDYSFNFCYPRFLEVISSELGLDDDTISSVRTAIEEKDLSRISDNPKVKELLSVSERFDQVSNVIETIQMLGELTRSDKYKGYKNSCKLLGEMKEIFVLLEKNGLDINISFDLFETNDFTYHTGLCFSVISRSNLEELGRGGRYNMPVSGDDIGAVGFTFKMNSLIRNIAEDDSFEGSKAIDLNEISLSAGDFKEISKKLLEKN